MAQDYKELVKRLETFISRGGNDLVLAIVKYSATQKGITEEMKKANETNDEEVAGLITKIILPRKPIPAKVSWTSLAEDAKKYPSQWANQQRSYNLDYKFWMTDPRNKMTFFFIFLTEFADEIVTYFDKFKELFTGNNEEKDVKNLFASLKDMLKDTSIDKALLFEELAKSVTISNFIYVYTAHFTCAIAIMYHDAVFGYLMLSNYWNDGAVYGSKNINAVAPNTIGKVYNDWKNNISNFSQKSRELIQKGYDELEKNTELSNATEYKKIRLNQLYSNVSSDIQMLVIINEKFNMNCDDEFNTSAYRVALGNGHYKTFKITIPD